jgi:hypothetical protein
MLKNLNKFVWAVILALPILANSASAQTPVAASTPKVDTTMETEQIDIIKPYQPILADAVKMNFSPEMPKVKIEVPKLTYNVPTRLLAVVPQSPELKAVMLPKDKQVLVLPTLYAKLGFGNYTTPYVDLRYNNVNNASFRYGVNLFHHSSNSAPNPVQRFAQSKAQLQYQYLMPANVLEGDITYTNDVFRPYSMNTESHKLSVNDKYMTHIVAPTIIFRKLNVDENKELDYKLTVKPYLLSRLDSTYHTISENGVWAEAKVQKPFENGSIAGIKVSEDYNSFSSAHQTWDPSLTVYKNALISASPFYNIEQKEWFARIGANVQFSQKASYINPDVELGKDLIAQNLQVYLGMKGNVLKNTYRSLLNVSPVLDSTLIKNTIRQDIFLGLRGSFNKEFTYNARFAYVQTKHQGFLTMADSNNLRNYHMQYVDGKASQFNVHAEVNYNKSEIIRAGFWADYTNYYLPNKFYANFTPAFISGLQANYKYEQNWEFGMQVFGWSNRQYMRGSALETLKGSVDLNLNAYYHYNSNVSAYIQLNNVANQKYSYTLGYPVYGINGMLGVVLRY